jgi:ABC-2 type transport system permease protein
VDRILIDLKFTLLRNSSKGLRVVGWFAGAGLVAGTWLATALSATSDVRATVLSLSFAGWVVGAAIGPVLMSGSGVLRADYFALLPIDRRALSRGLLLTTFVGIASGYVLCAFLAAVIHAFVVEPSTVVLVLIGAPLTWIFAIAVSRLVYGLLGAAMRSKIGVEIAGVQFGLMFAVMFTGWMVVQAAVQSIPALVQNGLPEGPITAVLDAVPSSWPLLAIEQAADGHWGAALGLLAALAVLDAVLLSAAIIVLTPSESVSVKRRAGRQLSPSFVSGGGLLPKTQLGAVIGKEYRQWTRDPWRALELRTGVWTGIAIGFFALVSGNYSAFAAFSGLIVAFMMSLGGLNLFGQDGTAVWQTIVGQDDTSTRSDVRGRQWALILVFLPHALLITLIFILLTQHFWVVPAVVAALPALFGVGSGVALLTSAVGVSPGVDPRRRVGPNDANGNVGLHVWVVLILSAISLAPTALAIVFSFVVPSAGTSVVAVGVGIANGWFGAWLFGRIAISYLSGRMPDVYSRIRYGQVFRAEATGVLGWIERTTLKSEQQMQANRQKERQDKIASARR